MTVHDPHFDWKADPADVLAWYAVETGINQEFRAKGAIIEMLRASGLEGDGAEVYCPVFEQRVVRRGKRKTRTRPLVPGYVFVRVRLTLAARVAVQQCSGVEDFLVCQETLQPLWIWDGAIRELRVVESDKAKTKPFCPGDFVWVREGWLKGRQAQVLAIDGHRRLTVAVEGGTVRPVSIPRTAVERSTGVTA